MNPLTIAFIKETSIPRERQEILDRIALELEKEFRLTSLPLKSPVGTKDDLGNFNLILAPYSIYQKQETKPGQIWIGYHSEPVGLENLSRPIAPNQMNILNFSILKPSEVKTLIKTLAYADQRSGLKPLFGLEPTLIYCENWKAQQGLGLRMDQILTLPEVSQKNWGLQANTIKILTLGLTSLLEEEHVQRAYFQLGASSTFFGFRMIYTPKVAKTHDQLIEKFWPGLSPPSEAAQILLRFSNALRVQTILNSQDIELTLGLFPTSSTLKKCHSLLQSLQVNQIAPELIRELPYEIPNPRRPELRILPPISIPKSGPKSIYQTETTQKLKNATSQPQKLTQSENTGILAMIEEFQIRYFEAQYQIRQFEIELQNMEKKGASAHELHELKLKMDALINRESHWIKKLISTLQLHKKTRHEK